MNDDVVERPGIAASRPVWGWPTRIAELVLTPWALAGFFRKSEDQLNHAVPWLVVLGGGVAEGRLDLAYRLFAQVHDRQGVVLTGCYTRGIVSDRAALVSRMPAQWYTSGRPRQTVSRKCRRWQLCCRPIRGRRRLW
jgi:hypothetical protein